MEIIVENWFLILVAIAAIAVLCKEAAKFMGKSKEQQLYDIRSWLLWATTLAEKELGSGTGRLKLRMVYDMFLGKFPRLANHIGFDVFSGLVDDVLTETKELVANNPAVQLFVNGPAGEENAEADG